jgi:hypothetical protein
VKNVKIGNWVKSLDLTRPKSQFPAKYEPRQET